jgi:hypothetical protein
MLRRPVRKAHLVQLDLGLVPKTRVSFLIKHTAVKYYLTILVLVNVELHMHMIGLIFPFPRLS